MLETTRQRIVLKACLGRQPEGWEEFLDEYLPLLHHVVCVAATQCGAKDQPTALQREDVLSGVITGLLANDMALIREFRGESGLDAYLAVVTRKLSLELWQSLYSREKMRARSNGRDAAAQGEEGQPLDEVEAMLGKLKPLEREAARLHFLEGCPHADVARQLKIPPESIGPLLARARRKIQKGRPGG